MKGPNLKNLYLKLAAAITALVIAVTVTVSLSYAWSILSTSPAVKGAQVVVSGGSTILVAPDVAVTESGVEYHYPGAFSTDLQFDSARYSYLSSLSGLTPVSTADGENWVVQRGSEKTLDTTLAYANRTDAEGGYVYVDFWVVAPGSDYYIRVATSSGSTARGSLSSEGGSALVGLPEAEDDGSGGLILGASDDSVAEAARVGFLVNLLDADQESVTLYGSSSLKDGRFNSLRGQYAAAGSTGSLYSEYNHFIIWEPDGLGHVDDSLDGSYLVTSPLGPDGADGFEEKNVGNILAVQTGSAWSSAEVGGMRKIDQTFSGWISQSSHSGLSAQEAASEFYASEGPRGLFSSQYITSGPFLRSTASLYGNVTGDAVPAAAIDGLIKAGTTDDAVICKLDADVPQRIRMFIWIEGADADCAAAQLKPESFVLNLQLAGADK